MPDLSVVRSIRRLVVLFAACGLLPFVGAEAQDAGDALPTIEAKTAGMVSHAGLFPVYWDADKGDVWLEIGATDHEFLYSSGLVTGLGSNDIGLDRNQLGGAQVVRFERVGRRVMLVEPNLRFRASSDNPAERQAVEEAFAESIVWGFDISAQTGDRILVDATTFLVRDVHGIVNTLKNSDQGTFSLDKSRSSPVPDRLRAFPQNTEMEARLTFLSDNPGRYVRDVAANPQAVTVRVRHSLIQLPDDGYETRAFDPRSGYYPMTFADYAVPIGESIEQRLITRHRLQCADAPGPDGLCTPVKPIVYYLDPGTPEPVQSALLEGASWWNDAFEAAGFRNGFRIEVRPESLDPMDVRVNTIQWVHRATRGWSYGSSITDPRTGEIIKGHVSLGSLRVRQDYLIAEGLLGPYEGANANGFADEASDPMLQLALARLRQLSAHEVGHTIGLAHNFAASTTERASVMDYPAPLSTLDGATIDVSSAYAVGIGDWDKQAVRYGYSPDASTMPTVLRENRERGLVYLTDSDARAPGDASPSAVLWDNGTDPIASLQNEMAVRRAALDRFGERAIRSGRPLATLEEALVPLYLKHRYQVEGTARLLGGVSYSYALRDGGDDATSLVPAARQLAALDALLATLDPDELALPRAVLALIPPRPPGYGGGRERFDRRTGPTLDPITPAETAADLVFDFILNPQRAARLVYQHDQDPNLPGLTDVLQRTTTALMAQNASNGYEEEIRRTIVTAWVRGLIALSADSDAATSVRARADAMLMAIGEHIKSSPGGGEDAAHSQWVAGEIRRYLERAHDPEARPAAVQAPPGSPIGME